MKRTLPFLLLPVALLAAGCSTKYIGETQIEDTEETGAVTGEITKVDVVNHKLTLRGANDDGGTYFVDAETSIMNGAKKIGLRDLQAGWRVVVNYDTSLKGVSKATQIEVVEGGAVVP